MKTRHQTKRDAASLKRTETLASVSRTGIEEILETKERPTDDAKRSDQISSLLNAPAKKEIDVGVCGAPAQDDDLTTDAVQIPCSIDRASDLLQEDADEADSDIEWISLPVGEQSATPPGEHLTPASQKRDDSFSEAASRLDFLGKKRLLAREEREQALARRHEALLDGIKNGLSLDTATNDEMLQSVMLSMAPIQMDSPDSKDPLDEIRPKRTWFRDTFKREGTLMSSQDRTFNEQLRAAVDAKSGPDGILTALFIALLKALGYQVRSLELLGLDDGCEAPNKKARKGSSKEELSTRWCEVWIDTSNKKLWSPVDVWTDRTDHSLDPVLPLWFKTSKSYVVAYYVNGVKDVSPRYIRDVHRCEQIKKDTWWQETLKPYTQWLETSLRDEAAFANNSKYEFGRRRWPEWVYLDLRARDQIEGEDEELESFIITRRLQEPKTIVEFKNSLKYVLERHIKRYQGLCRDAEPEGDHRGEPFYLRSDLEDLHTANIWIRHGREVKAEQLENPFKIVNKIHRQSKRAIPTEEDYEAEDEEEDGEEKTYLYAQSQTTPWKAPVAKDGLVPKNQYGKVDVPPLVLSLPIGTTHLRLPRVVALCRQLRIDYAVATVGFEPRGYGMIPMTDGVVVCTEYAQSVQDAYKEREREENKQEREKKAKSGREGWISLLNAVSTHLTLQERYVKKPKKESDRDSPEFNFRIP